MMGGFWKLASAALVLTVAASAAIGATGEQGAADDLDATLLSVDFRRTAPSDALAELGRQVGIPFTLNRGEDDEEIPEITFSADQRPFWEIFAELCRQANLIVAAAQNDVTQLHPRRDADWDFNHRLASSGPFVLVVRTCRRTTDIQYWRSDRVQTQMQLPLLVMAEPKVHILQTKPIRILEAVDESGQSLKAPLVHEIVFGGRAAQVNVPLAIVQPRSRKLALLRLEAAFVVRTRHHPIEIADCNAVSEICYSGAGVDWKANIAPVDDQHVEVVLQARRDGANDQQWPWISYPSDFNLIDDAGRSLKHIGESVVRQEGAMEYQLRFRRRVPQPVEAPLKLTWRISTEAKEVETRFELLDLPLP